MKSEISNIRCIQGNESLESMTFDFHIGLWWNTVEGSLLFFQRREVSNTEVYERIWSEIFFEGPVILEQQALECSSITFST
jgi:hypothetical protein